MKINAKSFIFGCLILLVAVSFIGSVNAITGSIGNGRMVLRAETGDKLEKYVRVINNNDVDVDIELFVSGDLADYIEIKDSNFTLEPGKEKNAYFTIDVRKSGRTESKINVKFTPKEGGNGVGLTSVVTVIAEGEDLGEKGIIDSLKNGGNTIIENIFEGDKNSATENVMVKDKKTKIAIALSITAVVLLIFIVVVILYQIEKKRREETKPKKKVRKK